MGRLIKLLAGLAVLGFLALTGYAYLADLSPATHEIRRAGDVACRLDGAGSLIAVP